MKTWRPTSRLRRVVTVAAIACLATTAAAALTATPAFAAGLSNPSLTVSNNATGATGVDYTWAFTTGTTATLGSITMTVPSGTAGTPVVGTVLGITGTSCGFSASGDGPPLTTITVKLTSSCGSVSIGTPIVVQITGLTNPTTVPTGTVTSTVNTFTTADGSGTATDTGTASPTWAYDSNATNVTVYVPESLTFENNSQTSILLVPIPGDAPVSAQSVQLTVSTNAANGYTLGACLPTVITGTTGTGGAGNGATIPSGKPATGTSNFGAAAAVTPGTGSLTASFTYGGGWAATTTAPTTLVGYPTTCGTTSSDSGTVTDSKPTSGDTITVTNSASASATQVAGIYSGTITYLATPHYS